MSKRIDEPEVDGQTRGVPSSKGVHLVQERASTAGTGAQRVGIHLPGTWRLKGVSIKNPNAAVLEASKIMIQYGSGTTFATDRPWFPLDTGECDMDLEHFYDPEDKIVQFATIYGEVTHGSSIAHTLSVFADQIRMATEEQFKGSPKPRSINQMVNGG